MTLSPEQKALATAFIAECWKPTPEWHQTTDEKADAQARNSSLTASRGNPELPFERSA